MTTRNILVLGSLNMDLVMQTKFCPAGGQTMHGEPDGFHTGAGGKGANQAVAVARLSNPSDTRVCMTGCVGEDVFGQDMLRGLKQDNVDVGAIKIIPNKSSGVAMIIVESNGENRILLSEGANSCVDISFVEALEEKIQHSDLLILQLEIPLPSVQKAVELAHKHQVDVLLNPAPAISLSAELLQHVSYLVPNEHEAAVLLGCPETPPTVQNAEVYADKLLAMGIRKAVIITLGSEGAFYKTKTGESAHIPARKVQAIDTTAAGDTFIGAFSTSISHDRPLKESLQFAAQSSAITVQRKGAANSIPTYTDIQNILR
ncbi:ribokinase Rbk1 [Schizosaccharomyces osmophilus]|uniref:Ribokinase n=1 Tax=Schizosaccharomyces osmophilus TaxID=2545709 RepID=A0AAE9WBI1_9SCHI|nr:ribokinase Rbk1 [Schizosaccharomyces osmophilus]WBW73155.1 ribokinase Rbk1 [Schizosaccharomyces osmophilus]